VNLYFIHIIKLCEKNVLNDPDLRFSGSKSSQDQMMLSIFRSRSNHSYVENPSENINIEIVFVSKSRRFLLMRMINTTEYAEHNRSLFFCFLNCTI